MSKFDIKVKRLEKIYQQTISEALIYTVADPRLSGKIISITEVNINEDFSKSEVLFTCSDKDDVNKIIKALYSCEKLFLTRLREKVKIKFLPSMRFFYDHKNEKAMEVENLIDRLSEEYGNDAEEDPADSNENEQDNDDA